MRQQTNSHIMLYFFSFLSFAAAGFLAGAFFAGAFLAGAFFAAAGLREAFTGVGREGDTERDPLSPFLFLVWINKHRAAAFVVSSTP